MLIIAILWLCIFLCPDLEASETIRYGIASWYSSESCKREGTSGIMANGRRLNDNEFICASWDYPFNTLLCVTNMQNGKRVFVYVQDRGPAKRLYKKGRIIDLSKRAFSELLNKGETLNKGLLKVKIERIK